MLSLLYATCLKLLVFFTTIFQINGLIQFFVSSTCFERHVFFIKMTICTYSLYGMFCIYLFIDTQHAPLQTNTTYFRVKY